MAGVSRFIREDLATTRYKGVEPLSAIAAEIGIAEDDLVKLNANENVYGAPAEVIEAIAKAPHHVYPDPSQSELRMAIAAHHGVDKECVCAGAGSDDILDIVLRMIHPEAVIMSTPTFGMYSFLGKLNGISIVDVPRKAGFHVDVEGIKAAVQRFKSSVVFLPSPNNPTGTLLSLEDTKEILKETDCILVVDEAYADFCDVTAMDLVGEHDNLIVTRTLSKWAGLAGLRLGYSVAHKDLTACMLAIKQPYNVNTAAEAGGLAALRHRDEILVTVNAMRAEKDRLLVELAKVPFLKPVPSDSNFVLCEVVAGLDAKTVYDALRAKGIIIRFFGAQGGDLSNYIRISAGKPADTDKVLAALADIAAQ